MMPQFIILQIWQYFDSMMDVKSGGSRARPTGLEILALPLAGYIIFGKLLNLLGLSCEN